MALTENCRIPFKACTRGKLDSAAIAWFTKTRKPDFCSIFGLSETKATNAVTVAYDYSERPSEVAYCNLNECYMTGTLTLTATGADSLASTNIPTNGEDYQNGYMRIMVHGSVGDVVKFSVRNSSDSTNKNVFNVTLESDGWNEAILELFNPDSVDGTGWGAKNEAIVLETEVEDGKTIKLSTIQMIKDIKGLVQKKVIGFNCMSDFSGDPTLSITEEMCQLAIYDKTATTFERSITATNVIGDLADFNSLMIENDTVFHKMRRTGRFKGVAVTEGGIKYASFAIPQNQGDKCDVLGVQPQDCHFSMLHQVFQDSDFINLDEEHFFIKGGVIYTDEKYVGKDFVVSYHVNVRGKAYDISVKDLNEWTYSIEMELPMCGRSFLFIGDNVFPTAFPETWSSESTDFTIPYTLAKGSDGKYGMFIEIDQRK